MSDTQTTFQEYTGFEVYLEGIQVPFSSFNIREIEGDFPSATVQFPANSGSLRVLGGTIVQIFGPEPENTANKILLFEGEIRQINYSKTGSSRAVSFEATSLLSQWQSVTARPKDSMVTAEWGDALGDYLYEYYNSTEKELENDTPETNSNFQDKTKAGEEEDPIEKYDSLGEPKLTVFSGLVDEISKLIGDDKISGGDLELFIDFFLKKFEEYDMFYGLVSNSFNIRESIFTSPNIGKIEAFKRKALIENFFTLSESKFSLKNGGTIKLMEAVVEFLNVFHYTLVAPSTYTGSLQFQSGNVERSAPIRGYFLPNMENSPPIKCNLLFPQQVSKINFSRNFLSEPTRTISEVHSVMQSGIIGSTKGFKPFAVQPKLNITQDGIDQNTIGLTSEETYRGITPNVVNQTSFFVETEKQDIIGETKSLEEAQKEEYQSKIKKPLNELTLNAHQQARMATRNMSISAVYTPYSMVGLPGAYIEPDKGPSFTGVIAAKTLSVSSQGSASTSITMRAVRTVHDLKDITEEDFEDAINDFTLDPYTDINSYLFDQSVYDFREIGKTLYPYLRRGTLSSKGSIFKQYAEDEQAFSKGVDALEKMEKQEQFVDTYDSILDILRDDSGDIQNRIATDLSPETGNNLRNSGAYTRDIYEAIYKYIGIYNEIPKEGSALKDFINSQTSRSIISKADYFASIGIDTASDIDNKSNYKDAISIFRGTEAGLKIRDSILEAQGRTTQKIIDNGDQEEMRRREVKLQQEVNSYKQSILEAEALFDDRKYTNTLLSLGKPNELALRENAYNALIEAQEKFEEISKELEDLRKELGSATQDSGTVDFVIQFDKEAFKPYNLTRRAHVNLAFRKQVRDALLKELRTNDALGNDNLTLLN